MSIAEPSAPDDGSSESVLSSVEEKKTVNFVGSGELKPAPEISNFLAL